MKKYTFFGRVEYSIYEPTSPSPIASMVADSKSIMFCYCSEFQCQ